MSDIIFINNAQDIIRFQKISELVEQHEHQIIKVTNTLCFELEAFSKLCKLTDKNIIKIADTCRELRKLYHLLPAGSLWVRNRARPFNTLLQTVIDLKNYSVLEKLKSINLDSLPVRPQSLDDLPLLSIDILGLLTDLRDDRGYEFLKWIYDNDKISCHINLGRNLLLAAKHNDLCLASNLIYFNASALSSTRGEKIREQCTEAFLLAQQLGYEGFTKLLLGRGVVSHKALLSRLRGAASHSIDSNLRNIEAVQLAYSNQLMPDEANAAIEKIHALNSSKAAIKMEQLCNTLLQYTVADAEQPRLWDNELLDICDDIRALCPLIRSVIRLRYFVPLEKMIQKVLDKQNYNVLNIIYERILADLKIPEKFQQFTIIHLDILSHVVHAQDEFNTAVLGKLCSAPGVSCHKDEERNLSFAVKVANFSLAKALVNFYVKSYNQTGCGVEAQFKIPFTEPFIDALAHTSRFKFAFLLLKNHLVWSQDVVDKLLDPSQVTCSQLLSVAHGTFRRELYTYFRRNAAKHEQRLSFFVKQYEFIAENKIRINVLEVVQRAAQFCCSPLIKFAINFYQPPFRFTISNDIKLNQVIEYQDVATLRYLVQSGAGNSSKNQNSLLHALSDYQYQQSSAKYKMCQLLLQYTVPWNLRLCKDNSCFLVYLADSGLLQSLLNNVNTGDQAACMRTLMVYYIVTGLYDELGRIKESRKYFTIADKLLSFLEGSRDTLNYILCCDSLAADSVVWQHVNLAISGGVNCQRLVGNIQRLLRNFYQYDCKLGKHITAIASYLCNGRVCDNNLVYNDIYGMIFLYSRYSTLTVNSEKSPMEIVVRNDKINACLSG